MSLIVKFKLGGEVRSLGSLNQSNATYDAIRNAVMRVFKLKGLGMVDKYSLQYADDEGDLIRISNNDDLQEAYALYLDAGKAELVIHLASGNSADFGFELVDDDDAAVKKSDNLVASSRNLYEPQPVVQKETVVEFKEVVVYKDHPLLNVMLAELVQHVTFPDRSTVGANSRLRKTWRVRNIGACSWPEGCVLMYHSGDKVFEAREFITSPVQPGEEVDLSIDVTSPARAGRYTTFYKLTNPSGKLSFGPHLWIDVNVQGSSALPAAEDDSKRVDHPKPAPAIVPDTPVSAPLECPQTFGKYNAGMLQLWNMGYKDTGRNLYLLDKYNGDTQNVVLFLIEHNY